MPADIYNEVWWLDDDPGMNFSRHFGTEVAPKTDIKRRIYLIDSRRAVQAKIRQLIKQSNGDVNRLIELFEDKYSWISHSEIVESLYKGELLRRPIGVELETGAILGFNRYLAAGGWHKALSNGQIPMTKALETIIEFSSPTEFKVIQELKKRGLLVYPDEEKFLLVPITAFLPNKVSSGPEVIEAIAKEYDMEAFLYIEDTGIDTDRTSAGQKIQSKGYATAKEAEEFNKTLTNKKSPTRQTLEKLLDTLKNPAQPTVVTPTLIKVKRYIPKNLPDDVVAELDKIAGFYDQFVTELKKLIPPQLLDAEPISIRTVEGIRDFWLEWMSWKYSPKEIQKIFHSVGNLSREVEFILRNSTVLPPELAEFLKDTLIREHASLLKFSFANLGHEINNVVTGATSSTGFFPKEILERNLSKSRYRDWREIVKEYVIYIEKTETEEAKLIVNIPVIDDGPQKPEPVFTGKIEEDKKTSVITKRNLDNPRLRANQDEHAEALLRVLGDNTDNLLIRSDKINDLLGQMVEVTVSPDAPHIIIHSPKEQKVVKVGAEFPFAQRHTAEELWIQPSTVAGMESELLRIQDEYVYIVKVDSKKLKELIEKQGLELALNPESQDIILGHIIKGVPIEDFPLVRYENGVLSIVSGQNRIRFAIDHSLQIPIALKESDARAFAEAVGGTVYLQNPSATVDLAKLPTRRITKDEALDIVRNAKLRGKKSLELAREAVEAAKYTKLLNMGVDFALLALDVFVFNKTKEDAVKLDLSDDLLLTKKEYIKDFLAAKQEFILEDREPFIFVSNLNIAQVLQNFISGSWTRKEFNDYITETLAIYNKLLNETPSEDMDFHPQYFVQRYEIKFAIERIKWLRDTGHDLEKNIQRIKNVLYLIRDEFITGKSLVNNTARDLYAPERVTIIDDVMEFYKKSGITEDDLVMMDRILGIKPSEFIWGENKAELMSSILEYINIFENSDNPITEQFALKLFSKVFPIIQDFTFTRLNREQVEIFRDRIKSNALGFGATAALAGTIEIGPIGLLIFAGLALLDIFGNAPDNVKLTRNALLMPDLKHTNTSPAFNKLVDFINQTNSFKGSKEKSINRSVKDFILNKYSKYNDEYNKRANYSSSTRQWFSYDITRSSIQFGLKRIKFNSKTIFEPVRNEFLFEDDFYTAQTLFNILKSIDIDNTEPGSEKYQYFIKILNIFQQIRNTENDIRNALLYARSTITDVPQKYLEEWKTSKTKTIENISREFIQGQLNGIEVKDDEAKKFIEESKEQLAIAVREQTQEDNSNAIFNALGDIYNKALKKGYITPIKKPQVLDIQPKQLPEIPVYTNIFGAANKPTVTPGDRPIESQGQVTRSGPWSAPITLSKIAGTLGKALSDAITESVIKTSFEENEVIKNRVEYAKREKISLEEVEESINRALSGNSIELDNLRRNKLLTKKEEEIIELNVAKKESAPNVQPAIKSFKEAEDLNDKIFNDALDMQNAARKAQIAEANKAINDISNELNKKVDEYNLLLRDIQNKFIDDINNIRQNVISDENIKNIERADKTKETIAKAKSQYFSIDDTNEKKKDALKLEIKALEAQQDKLAKELANVAKDFGNDKKEVKSALWQLWSATAENLKDNQEKVKQKSKELSELQVRDVGQETSKDFLERTAQSYAKAKDDIYKYEKELENADSSEKAYLAKEKLDIAKAAVAVWENEFIKKGSTYNKLVESNKKKDDAEKEYKRYQNGGVASVNREEQKKNGNWSQSDEKNYQNQEKEARDKYNKETRNNYQNQIEALKSNALRTALEVEEKERLRNKYGVGGQGQGQKQNGHSYGCACSSCKKLADDIEKKRQEDEAQKYFAELARLAAEKKEKEEQERRAKEAEENAKKKAEEEAKRLSEELQKALDEIKRKERELKEKLMADGLVDADEEFLEKVKNEAQVAISDIPPKLLEDDLFINIHPQTALVDLINSPEPKGPLIEPDLPPDIIPENLRVSPIKPVRKVVPTAQVPIVNPPTIPLNGPWVNPEPSIIKKVKIGKDAPLRFISDPKELKTDPGFIPEPLKLPEETLPKPPEIKIPDISPITPPEIIIVNKSNV